MERDEQKEVKDEQNLDTHFDFYYSRDHQYRGFGWKFFTPLAPLTLSSSKKKVKYDCPDEFGAIPEPVTREERARLRTPITGPVIRFEKREYQRRYYTGDNKTFAAVPVKSYETADKDPQRILNTDFDQSSPATRALLAVRKRDQQRDQQPPRKRIPWFY